MPITQIMQKLSSRRDRRNSTGAVAAAGPNTQYRITGDSMECCTSFEVVAEVLPLAPGSQAGSMCSSISNSDNGDVAHPLPPPSSRSSTQHRQQPTIALAETGRQSSSSAALLASSSLSGPLPRISLAGSESKPATERALRSLGKAMLRTQSGLPGINTSCSPTHELDLQQQLSLESSSSMMDATSPGSLPYGVSSHLASPRLVRSATAPLPGSLRSTAPGSLAAAVAAGEGTSPQQHVGSSKGFFKAAAPSPIMDDDAEEHEGQEEDGDNLISPAAAGPQQDEHCHWEDGVVASWLQGIDHSELLHDGEDHEEQEAAGKQMAAAGGAGPSSQLPQAVYSSLLYK